MNVFAGFLLLVLMLSPAASAATDSGALIQMQKNAATLYREGRYSEAAGLFKKLAEQTPDNVDVQRDLMWASEKAGDKKSAAGAAEQILSGQPADLEALAILAGAHAAAGRTKKAVQTYQALLKAHPSHTPSKIELAQLHEESGNLTDAERLLEQAGNEAPGNKTIYPRLAKIQTRRGDLINAANSWGKAARHAPDRSDYRYLEAKSRLDGGQTDAALKQFRRLLKDKDQKRRALDALVAHAIDSGRPEQAAKLYRDNLRTIEGEDDLNRLLRQAWLYRDMDRIDESLEAVDRLLEKDPESSKAALLKADFLYDHKRDYEEAEIYYLKALQNLPDDPKIYPRLAQSQFLQGEYKKAAASWAMAAELSPDRKKYVFAQAESLYFDKQYDKAARTFNSLLDDPEVGLRALDFLTGDRAAQGDRPGAALLIENHPRRKERLFQLATLYRDIGEPKKSVSVVDEHLESHPNDSKAWLLKASCLIALEKKKPVYNLYRKMAAANPNSVLYLTQYAESQYNIGKIDDAIETLQKAQALDPTNPYLILKEAGYEFDRGNVTTARLLALTWLKKNQGPALPVLVYHGLSPDSRNPILLHRYHITNAVFENHIKALKEAGFTSVTPAQVLAWHRGEGRLPKRPVMIAFDDARRDSFRNADPILKAHGMKAVMFVPIYSVGRNWPNYSSWNELLAWKKTGRWDIQAHGDKGHVDIPVDRFDARDMFLARRMWLKEENRLESEKEWRERVRADHKSAVENLTRHIGETPIAFSYPESNYSQFNLIDSPNPMDNIRIAKEVFPLAFHEDRYGLNVRSRDPGLLSRLLPTGDLSGDELVRHILDQNPFSQARISLLKWSVWEGKTREAFRWLEDLKRSGASEYRVLMEEARIHISKNNLARAQELIDKARNIKRKAEPLQSSKISWPQYASPIADVPTNGESELSQAPAPAPDTSNVYEKDEEELDPVVAELKRQKRPRYDGRGLIGRDNRDRRYQILDHALSFYQEGNTAWRLVNRLSRYEEDRFPTVEENAVGVGLNRQIGLYNNFDLQGLGHLFSEELDPTYSVRGSLDTSWTDQFRTELRGQRAPVYTARALNREITEAWGEANALLYFQTLWRGRVRGRTSDLSDDNTRKTFTAELSRYLKKRGELRFDYRLTTDDMELLSDDYYSPRNLVQHQIGFDWPYEIIRDLEFHVSYLPGVGKESDAAAHVVHSLAVELLKRQRRFFGFGVGGGLDTTPTYRAYYARLDLDLRF